MGFEKTDDTPKSAVEGFETDVIDLDGGSSEDIKAVKAPRRSSRKEPRFGVKRDRLGRKATNTDEASDSDEMVAPVRPVRLSGSGAVHIQKPVMKEGSDFAYLFTDQDEDQNDRHMDRAKASRLDGLAYNEETDGDGEMYADLFSQTASQNAPAPMPVRKEIPAEAPVPPAAGRAPEPQEVRRQAAADGSSETSKKRSMFNRHSRSAEKKDTGGAQSADVRMQDDRDRRGPGGDDRYYDGDHDRGRYDRGYDRDYDRDRYEYDRYYDRDRRYDDYDRGYDRDYDRDYDRRYDRRYEEDEPDPRRYGHYDRYRREPEPYEAEPVYPPAGYQMMPGVYPSVMGGYQPVYYTPAPMAPVPPVQPVQYVQGAVYGVPIQGVPVQGMPVQGVPVQNIAVPAAGAYNYPVEAAQPQQPVQTAEIPQEADAAVGNIRAEESPAAVPPAGNEPAAEQTGSRAGGSRFNRRGSHEKPRAAEAEPQQAPETPPSQAEPYYEQTVRQDGGAPEPQFTVPTEDSIPHFRPRSRHQAPAAQEVQAEQPESTGAPSDEDGPSAESRPAEPRFRRRHS